MQLSGEVTQLDAQVNGSGRLDAGSLRAAGAELKSSGSGSLFAGELRGEHASIGVHGSGKVQARGTVRSLTVHTSGSGSADLAGLTCDRADLSSSGSGGITTYVRENLSATATGSGTIHVRGNPVQRSISGRSVRLD
jgi:hypothetical protein